MRCHCFLISNTKKKSGCRRRVVPDHSSAGRPSSYDHVQKEMNTQHCNHNVTHVYVHFKHVPKKQNELHNNNENDGRNEKPFCQWRI